MAFMASKPSAGLSILASCALASSLAALSASICFPMLLISSTESEASDLLERS